MRRNQVIALTLLVGCIEFSIAILGNVISNQIERSLSLPIAIVMVLVLLITLVLVTEHLKKSEEMPAHALSSNSDIGRSNAGIRVQYLIAVLAIILLTFGGLALSHGAVLPWGGGSTPRPSTPSPSASANVGPNRGPSPSAKVSIGWSRIHQGYIALTLEGFPAGSYDFICETATDGFTSSNGQIFVVSISKDPQTIDNGNTCYEAQPGYYVHIFLKEHPEIGSKAIKVGTLTSIPTPTPTPPTVTPTPPVSSYPETTGGITHTWSNYMDADGIQGPTVPAYATIQISCKVLGFKVSDGNPWWYRIQSSPWSNQYYASADAFYNNGQTSGALAGTPFVDPNVPNC